MQSKSQEMFNSITSNLNAKISVIPDMWGERKANIDHSNNDSQSNVEISSQMTLEQMDFNTDVELNVLLDRIDYNLSQTLTNSKFGEFLISFKDSYPHVDMEIREHVNKTSFS